LYKKNKIILASSSKQRQALLRQLGINNFKVIPPVFDEDNYKVKLPITKKVVELSYLKANSIKTNCEITDEIIISADTEVLRCGKLYSKCHSKDDVKNHLSQLSGRKHFVYGGICVIDSSGKIHKRLVKSEVYFDLLSDNELSNPVLLNEGVGKAGGYAIQGMGGKFIRKIRGSYSNVVGLCLNSLYKILTNIGFKN
jgi:septum formation protein